MSSVQEEFREVLGVWRHVLLVGLLSGGGARARRRQEGLLADRVEDLFQLVLDLVLKYWNEVFVEKNCLLLIKIAFLLEHVLKVITCFL